MRNSASSPILPPAQTTDPEQAHIEQLYPDGLSWNQLAQVLGIKRGTLSRKVIEHNREARKQGLPVIEPDRADHLNGGNKHYFNATKVPAIRAAIGTVKRRGRPRKNPIL